MHCPRCGQKQVSEDIKFCSRCGFPLGLVSEILSHGGFLPQLADLHKTKIKFTKNNGIKFSVLWFLVWTFLITPLLALADGDEIVAVAGVIGVMGGLLLLFFSIFFLKNPASEFTPLMNEPSRNNMNNIHGANTTALPPPQSIPVDAYMPPSGAGSWKAPDTGELAQPHSVVEDTTKLLQKDKKG